MRVHCIFFLFTSEIWPQSYVITFQQSVHRLFNHRHIARVIDTDTMEDKTKERERERAADLDDEIFSWSRKCPSVFHAVSNTITLRGKTSGASSDPSTYLWAQTTAANRGTRQTRTQLILLILNTAILVLCVCFFFF